MVRRSFKNDFVYPIPLHKPQDLFLAGKKVYNPRGMCTKIW